MKVDNARRIDVVDKDSRRRIGAGNSVDDKARADDRRWIGVDDRGGRRRIDVRDRDDG